MKKNQLFLLLLLAVGSMAFSSCEQEEETARALSGIWEGDMGIERVYNGKTVKPYKTVLVFEQEKATYTFGEGYMVEYYDNELKEVYNRLRWDVWRRNNGNPGIEIKTTNYPELKFTLYDDFTMDDNTFSGIYSRDNKEIHFNLKRITSAPDISQASWWGYDEKLPTWHPTTYEGKIGISREYNGKTYQPTSVTVTFNCDPVYNETNYGPYKSYIKETYDEAPWGTVLADTIRDWRVFDYELRIYTYDGTEYTFHQAKVTNEEITGEWFIRTNVFDPFTLKKVATPDWSTIREWGIQDRIK